MKRLGILVGILGVSRSAAAQPAPLAAAPPPAAASTATVDHTSSTTTEPDLPWYNAPPFVEAPPPPPPTHDPQSINAAVDFQDLSGDLSGSVTMLNIVASFGNFTAVAGIGSADLALHDMDHAEDLAVSTRVYGGGLGYGINNGKELYAGDGMHVYVLAPALRVQVTTDGDVVMGALRFRLVGLRIQWCPGLVVDVEPSYTYSAADAGDPTDPALGMAKRYSATGSGVGASISVGYIVGQK